MTKLLLRCFVPNYENTADPAVRERYGLLSGGVGILLNLLLTLGKLLSGMATGAVSVTADAFNNLSDAATSVVTLVGFRLAGRKADRDHPYGHGRMEYLAGLAVSVAILLVGVELARGALDKILHPVPVRFSPLTAAVLLASILVKMWMYLFNRSLGRRISSASLAATAADSLSDCVATGAVLLGLVVGHVTQLAIDGWVGILVAAFVLRAGWESAKDTVDPLLGKAPDPALVEGIRQCVLAHPEVVGVHDLMVHDYGPGHVIASLHAEVSMDADMSATHDVIDIVERELGEKFHLLATIHMDPIATNDEHVNATREVVAALARQLHPEATIHDFRMTAGPRHTNLIFDVALPIACPLSDQEARERLAQLAREADPGYVAVVQVDRVYA